MSYTTISSYKPKEFNAWVSRAPHVKHKCLAPLAHLVSTISRMSSKCCNITYFLCEYTVFCLHRLLCAARMNFEQLLLEFLSSIIWTATIAKHWSLSSAWHQLFLSVYQSQTWRVIITQVLLNSSVPNFLPKSNLSRSPAEPFLWNHQLQYLWPDYTEIFGKFSLNVVEKTASWKFLKV